MTGVPPVQHQPIRAIRAPSNTSCHLLAHDLRDTDHVDRKHFTAPFGDICTLLPTATQGWARKQLTETTPETLSLSHNPDRNNQGLTLLVKDEYLEHELETHGVGPQCIGNF